MSKYRRLAPPVAPPPAMGLWIREVTAAIHDLSEKVYTTTPSGASRLGTLYPHTDILGQNGSVTGTLEMFDNTVNPYFHGDCFLRMSLKVPNRPGGRLEDFFWAVWTGAAPDDIPEVGVGFDSSLTGGIPTRFVIRSYVTNILGAAGVANGANMVRMPNGDIAVSVSSRRYKDDIQYLTAEECTELLKGFKPASFRMKTEMEKLGDEAGTYYNFIAEDVAELGENASPLVVRNPDGQPERLNDSAFNPIVVGTVQKLLQDNEKLTERVNDLTALVESLAEQVNDLQRKMKI